MERAVRAGEIIWGESRKGEVCEAQELGLHVEAEGEASWMVEQ